MMSLRERGHIVIRNAFPAEAVDALHAQVARFFAEFEQREVGERERWLYETFGNLTLDCMVAAGFTEIDNLFTVIQRSPIAGLISAHFGDDIVIPRNHVLGRHYRPPYDNVVPLHQDIAVIDPRASVTSWIPLTDCGVDAPGLEVVDALVTNELPKVAGDYSIDPSAMCWPTAHPTFQRGDAILFLNTTPHRSYVTPQMTRPRYSFEVRYMPRKAIISDDDMSNLVDVTPDRKRSAVPPAAIEPSAGGQCGNLHAAHGV